MHKFLSNMNPSGNLKIHPKSFLVLLYILFVILIKCCNCQDNNTLSSISNIETISSNSSNSSSNISNNSNINAISDNNNNSNLKSSALPLINDNETLSIVITSAVPTLETTISGSIINNNNNVNHVNIFNSISNKTSSDLVPEQHYSGDIVFPEIVDENFNKTTILNSPFSQLPILDATSNSTCAGHKLLDDVHQPKFTQNARLKKCCPVGENYQLIDDVRVCAKENMPFEAPVIDATFYENCIEDNEIDFKLANVVGYPCKKGTAFIYNKNYGDILYVLKNGSLLRIDVDYTTYDIFDEYCLDVDRDELELSAIVCNQTLNSMVHVSRAQSYIYAICMLTSVPCLLITVFFYLAIPQLRNLHGKSLACHSLCLAFGFLLLSIAQLKENVGQVTGYIIQYLILACFFWLAVMCIDICTHVWWFVPRKITLSRRSILIMFIIYACIAMGFPLMLVLLSVSFELPGMPSYYLKGLTETTRSSQQFFIPPISTILFICFGLLVLSYFGFRQLNSIVSQSFLIRMHMRKDNNVQSDLHLLNHEHFEEVKQIAKSTSLLYAIMTINWIFEIISFYVDSSSDSLIIFDILNALQGIVIFIIFVALEPPLSIIKRWWMDRGTLYLNTMTELEELNSGNNNGTTNHTDEKSP